MSHLHQTSGKAVKTLAQETGVSSSYISRLLTGERLPTWNMAEQLTTSCGGDPAEIRPLWEAARGMRPRLLTDAAAAELQATVRGLHLAAQRPSPARVCAMSPQTVVPEDVTALLYGNTPDWPVVNAIVDALRGRPEDIRPLWEHARQHPCAHPHPLHTDPPVPHL
ncbi:helix-turn-helix domain-containing protein [Streptacidiphilus sp. 4-A2]|nr:helix-turn-helix domain-containing protein [Streptacidiphilus sp. 4-A2]